MLAECNLSGGGQHCFVPVRASMGNDQVYSCPTCGIIVLWRDLGWVELYAEDGYLYEYTDLSGELNASQQASPNLTQRKEM